MFRSLVITKIESNHENGDVHLTCKMEKPDIGIYLDHPRHITLLGVVYVKTGWNSDKCVVHYKRVR